MGALAPGIRRYKVMVDCEKLTVGDDPEVARPSRSWCAFQWLLPAQGCRLPPAGRSGPRARCPSRVHATRTRQRSTSDSAGEDVRADRLPFDDQLQNYFRSIRWSCLRGACRDRDQRAGGDAAVEADEQFDAVALEVELDRSILRAILRCAQGRRRLQRMLAVLRGSFSEAGGRLPAARRQGSSIPLRFTAPATGPRRSSKRKATSRAIRPTASQRRSKSKPSWTSSQPSFGQWNSSISPEYFRPSRAVAAAASVQASILTGVLKRSRVSWRTEMTEVASRRRPARSGMPSARSARMRSRSLSARVVRTGHGSMIPV